MLIFVLIPLLKVEVDTKALIAGHSMACNSSEGIASREKSFISFPILQHLLSDQYENKSGITCHEQLHGRNQYNFDS